MSRKVFTAGEVLAAADVNSFLMDQTVMSFAGTAARGSAIGTATEGMYTHLEDTDDLQFWNGSAWRSPLGLTRLVNQTFTGVSTLNIDNVFTSQYENYRIDMKVDSVTGGTVTEIFSQLRRAGSALTTNYYAGQIYIQVVGSPTTGVYYSRNNGSNWRVFATGVPGVPSYTTLDISAPNISTTHTNFTLLGQHQYGGATLPTGSSSSIYGGAVHAVNTDADGINFITGSGTMTGNIKIYGYRN